MQDDRALFGSPHARCCAARGAVVTVRIRKYAPWWIVVTVFIISLPVRLVAYAVDRWRAR